MLMAWCFSTRASVATVLTTHPCVARCLGIKDQSVPKNSWDHSPELPTRFSTYTRLKPKLISASLNLNLHDPGIAQIFLFKLTSAKYQPFCLCLNMLTLDLPTYTCQQPTILKKFYPIFILNHNVNHCWPRRLTIWLILSQAGYFTWL